MDLDIAEPFAQVVDLNRYPSYVYIVEFPVDLAMIRRRLENRFYRRVAAVQYDVRCIYKNACKFNESRSIIVRNASIITDLCLAIIRGGSVADVKDLYLHVASRWRERCLHLVLKLKISDDGAPFRRPVNYLQYPDYRGVVGFPMDLSIVHRRLEVSHEITWIGSFN